jgi:enoyl-[acyl-carrier protein] reductase II
MLRTPFCELMEVEVPVLQAAIAPYTPPELVAAVSNAGALGTVSTGFQTIDQVRSNIRRTQELTDRPFVVNFVTRALDDEIFALALEARPKAISFALGNPGDHIKRAHDAGMLVIQQVHTVDQARTAAEWGADVIIAQGTEAGGFGQMVAALPLVPQVVDAVHPVPVLAAGGIADGRGLAAALVLGAQGANVGTRFLASTEASTEQEWKQALVDAQSEDAIRFEVFNDLVPPSGGNFETAPRVLRTRFVEQWQQHRYDAQENAENLRGQIMTAMQQGRIFEYLPFSGQSAGLIHDVLPAGEIVRRLAVEAEDALERAAQLRRV